MKILKMKSIANRWAYSLMVTLLLLGSIQTSFAQTVEKKELSWDELRKQYEFPKWYTEARFGIWCHWGAQTQPEEGGGWPARHIYVQNMDEKSGEAFGKNAYPNHLKNYGHPSEVGFKDVIHSWKAEHLNTDSLMQYFKKVGAKYFMVLANHCDNFDNFNSTYQKWNSVNVGPKRDIVGEFEKSAKKYNLPFAVSSHDFWMFGYFDPAFGSDATGPKKGIPYDGNMTKEDGKGKWWEGLDPADLYGLPPAKRTPEWIEGVKKNWVLRLTELVTKYDVDMLWYDGWGFPYGDYGKEVCRTLFNNSLKKNGKIMAVAAGKVYNDSAIVKDVECGSFKDIQPRVWQGIITTGGGWFYKKDREIVHNARTVIEMLADVNSKNGNLMLNVELLPDGTIPAEDKIILDEVGAWMKINGEAVYSSKPWKVYGDNLKSYLKRGNISNADLEALKKEEASEQFNQRTVKSPLYGNDEVRFTTKGDILYVFVLNPIEGNIELPALGLKSPNAPNKIKSIKMVGSKRKIEYNQDDKKLVFKVPADRPNKYITVFEVKGVL
jgi:alpha-L-fucosidase